MRLRLIVEILIVIGVLGLMVEIAEGHTWLFVAAGVAGAIWLLSRASQ
jgi:hypothetical protein